MVLVETSSIASHGYSKKQNNGIKHKIKSYDFSSFNSTPTPIENHECSINSSHESVTTVTSSVSNRIDSQKLEQNALSLPNNLNSNPLTVLPCFHHEASSRSHIVPSSNSFFTPSRSDIACLISPMKDLCDSSDLNKSSASFSGTNTGEPNFSSSCEHDQKESSSLLRQSQVMKSSVFRRPSPAPQNKEMTVSKMTAPNNSKENHKIEGKVSLDGDYDDSTPDVKGTSGVTERTTTPERTRQFEQSHTNNLSAAFDKAREGSTSQEISGPELSSTSSSSLAGKKRCSSDMSASDASNTCGMAKATVVSSSNVVSPSDQAKVAQSSSNSAKDSMRHSAVAVTPGTAVSLSRASDRDANTGDEDRIIRMPSLDENLVSPSRPSVDRNDKAEPPKKIAKSPARSSPVNNLDKSPHQNDFECREVTVESRDSDAASTEVCSSSTTEAVSAGNDADGGNKVNSGGINADGSINPNDNDVLCGRGGATNNHPGNRHFRDLVKQFQRTYLRAKKKEKPRVAKQIVDLIRNRTPTGRFLKKEPEKDGWYDIGDQRATEKTSQALREGAPDIRVKEKEEARAKVQSEMAAARDRNMRYYGYGYAPPPPHPHHPHHPYGHPGVTQPPHSGYHYPPAPSQYPPPFGMHPSSGPYYQSSPPVPPVPPVAHGPPYGPHNPYSSHTSHAGATSYTGPYPAEKYGSASGGGGGGGYGMAPSSTDVLQQRGPYEDYGTDPSRVDASRAAEGPNGYFDGNQQQQHPQQQAPMSGPSMNTISPGGDYGGPFNSSPSQQNYGSYPPNNASVNNQHQPSQYGTTQGNTSYVADVNHPANVSPDGGYRGQSVQGSAYGSQPTTPYGGPDQLTPVSTPYGQSQQSPPSNFAGNGQGGYSSQVGNYSGAQGASGGTYTNSPQQHQQQQQQHHHHQQQQHSNYLHTPQQQQPTQLPVNEYDNNQHRSQHMHQGDNSYRDVSSSAQYNNPVSQHQMQPQDQYYQGNNDPHQQQQHQKKRFRPGGPPADDEYGAGYVQGGNNMNSNNGNLHFEFDPPRVGNEDYSHLHQNQQPPVEFQDPYQDNCHGYDNRRNTRSTYHNQSTFFDEEH